MRILGLLVAVLLGTGASAQEGVPTDSAFCTGHGRYQGASCPGCASFVPPGGGGVPPPDLEAQARERLARLNTAYLDLVRFYRSFDVPTTAQLAKAGAAASLDALSARVDHLYVAARRQANALSWLHERNRQRLAGIQGWIDASRARRDAAETALPRLRAEQADLRRRSEGAEQAFKADRAAAEQLQAAVDRALRRYRLRRERGGRAFEAVLPPADWARLWERLRTTPTPEALRFQPPPAAPGPVAQVPPAAVNLVAKVPPPPAWAAERIAPPRGTPEERLLAVEDLKAVYGDVGMAVKNQNARLAPLDAALAAAQAEESRVGELVRKAEEEIRWLSRQVALFQEGSAKDSAEGRRLALNLAKSVVLDAAWEGFNARVMVPAVKRFLQANGLEDAAEIARFFKEPARLLPETGPGKDLPRLLEAAEKILDVEKDFETWARRAVETGSDPAAAPLDALSGVLRGVERRGVEFFELACEALPPWAGKLARRALEQDPRD